MMFDEILDEGGRCLLNLRHFITDLRFSRATATLVGVGIVVGGLVYADLEPVVNLTTKYANRFSVSFSLS